MIGIIVDDILIPDILVEVDVPDKHAVTGKIRVPALLLAVFDKEEFIGVAGLNDIAGV